VLTVVTSVGTFLIRGLKDEHGVFPDWPAPVRLALATVLGVIVAAGTNVETAADFLSSLLTGFVAALPTILMELLDLLKKVRLKSVSLGQHAAIKTMMVLVLFAFAASSQACAAACPIIHAADQICPLVVEINGKNVVIPKEPVVTMARQKMAADEKSAAEKGGVK
jgi:hypothetical protein